MWNDINAGGNLRFRDGLSVRLQMRRCNIMP